VGTSATAFATVINPGATAAADCTITLADARFSGFSAQTTDPATNAVVGTPDTPVTIAAGAAQSFVFTLAPNAPLDGVDAAPRFDCANSKPVAALPGINTLLMSSAVNATPDIVALALTPTGDGILHLPATDGANAFAVASVNVGVAGTLTASVDTGTAVLPLDLEICATDALSNCIEAPAPSVTLAIAANATPTFSVFVFARGAVALDPAVNRLAVRFRDPTGAVRGSTSVAVRTP
jgi:hypothetical protein